VFIFIILTIINLVKIMSGGHVYTINGVSVSFPHKAYPSQVAMMSHIIKALQRGQNALLESPTGSGKSLALLCAALAWQRREADEARRYNRAVEEGLVQPQYVAVGEDGEESDVLDAAVAEAALAKNAGFIPEDEEVDSISPPKKRLRPELGQNAGQAEAGLPEGASVRVKKKSAPKIFFGTRTHKQIAQIIRELNKTAYREASMTILGSRDHTCIHPVVSRMKNRNEGCKELTDRRKGGGCPYQANVKVKLANPASVAAYRGRREAWDLEDLVKVGKKVRACPYFASRELMAKADVVFCPYNYLVEPIIRQSLDIKLRGQVLIMDEAHNIEDSARSAASWQVSQDEVQEAMRDLERLAAAGSAPESHSELALLCSQMSTWIDSVASRGLEDYKDFSSSSKIWKGTEALAALAANGLGRVRYEEVQKHFEKAMAEYQAAKSNAGEEGVQMDPNAPETPIMAATTMGMLEGFFMIFNNMYMHGMRHTDDYRVALTRSQVRNQPKTQQAATNGRNLGMWLGKRGGQQGGQQGEAGFRTVHTLNFWCLNPAVSFLELKEELRSVVLTSGTLSPMSSFSTELDVDFPLKLEAAHVVDKRQVWIGTLSRGPNGQSLNATYRNSETFAFQDEVGKALAGVCEAVPRGVLFFLPSYSMLNKLSERWRDTGLWDRLTAKKVVISEPRFNEEFEESIKHFNEIIRDTHGQKGGGVDGALYMAVCRGKVSEGIDFADDHARAVVCVGIPFPNFKDIQVDLKKKYNDGRRSNGKANVLSGGEWYESQAFRALNQALGRCIRHRNDWGAILMVDDRYQRNQRYVGGLSKWVRSGVRHFSRFDELTDSLTDFKEDMLKRDKELAEAKSSEVTATQSKVQSNFSQVKAEPAVSQVGFVKSSQVMKAESEAANVKVEQEMDRPELEVKESAFAALMSTAKAKAAKTGKKAVKQPSPSSSSVVTQVPESDDEDEEKIEVLSEIQAVVAPRPSTGVTPKLKAVAGQKLRVKKAS